MNNIKHFFISILLLCIASTSTIHSVSILNNTKIQAAGSAVFSANKSFPTSVISWKSTRYFIDETSGATTYAADTISSTGDNVQITLSKTTGKYTFYKIIAYEGTQADSIVIQILLPGVVQKYLYTNLSLSKYSIPVWVVLPSKYSVASKFLVAMCGINRDASNIATYWVPFANTNNYVIAAPEFNSTNWSSDAYILGNMFTGSSGTGNLNPQQKWSFNIVEQIHRELYSSCGLKDSTYELWGHSAGGQFVHRLAFFLPDNLASRYIAGNSGWYTCPDLSVIFPWGAQNNQLNLSNQDLSAFTNRKLVIMRGTADTLRDGSLNTDPLSDAQGLNRYTRAGYFYNSGIKVNNNLIWKLVDVPNVGHDDQKMAIAGGNFILANPTSVNEVKNVRPQTFSISNYPNPFNPSTKIAFALKNSSQISLYVYNIWGQLVSRLEDRYLNPGFYTFEFNAARLPSGIYFCRIIGEHINSTVKMELLK